MVTVLAGCAADQDEPTTAGTERPPDTTTASPAQEDDGASEMSITAHEFSFEAPEVVPAGEVTLTLENEGALAHHAQLLQIPSGSVETFEDDDAFGTVMNQATFLGGPASVGSKDTSPSVTTTLQPGTYAFLCFLVTDGVSHAARGMRTTFVVEGERTQPAEPSTDGTIGLEDFAFELPDAFDASGRFLVENGGNTDHEMSILRVPDGSTASEVREQLDAFDGSVPAPDTLTFAGGVQALRVRETNAIDIDLDAGTYALVCFVPGDGGPHWKEGMLEVVEVPDG